MNRPSVGALLVRLPIALSLLAAACATDVTPSTTATSTTVARTNTSTTLPPTTTTLMAGMAVGEQVPGEPLWAVVSGNSLEADRINLVLAPWGWDDQAEFAALAADILSWDGDAYWIGASGQIVHDPSDAIDAQLGLFAIEPWRSSRDQFNVWITDVEPETPVSWINVGDPPFSLPDQSVVIIGVDTHRFNPELTSVAGQRTHFVGPEPPSRAATGTPFANLVVVVDSAFPAEGLAQLPHELGHAMFNLPDEYVGQQFGFDGREDLSGWPSCAESQVEADEWWNDLVGDVDTMVDIWAEEMSEAGFALADPEALSASAAVSNVDGGCYGVGGSIRATLDSLMNGGIPVLRIGEPSLG